MYAIHRSGCAAALKNDLWNKISGLYALLFKLANRKKWDFPDRVNIRWVLA